MKAKLLSAVRWAICVLMVLGIWEETGFFTAIFVIAEIVRWEALGRRAGARAARLRG